MLITWVIWLVGAYVLGSVSFALILGRANGIDIRRHGSGNVGATNLGRALGKKWGILCFVLDLFKGLLPVVGYRLTLAWMDIVTGGSVAMLFWLSIGVAAVLGHVFPIYLKFKGGKGMATGMGVLLGYWPMLSVPALAAFVVWFLVTKATAYVGLASVIAAAVLPVFVVGFGIVMGYQADLIAVCGGVSALLAALVIVRHIGNIKRLLAGTEDKVDWAQRKRADTGEAS